MMSLMDIIAYALRDSTPAVRAEAANALAQGFQACTLATAVDSVGCLIPRLSFQQPNISKLDMRLTKNINARPAAIQYNCLMCRCASANLGAFIVAL